jgi:hypothetical protein
MRLLKALTTAAIAAALLLVPAGALAKSRDRDHDRMADKWEKRHHLNVRANDARKDPDRDHLSNLSEFRHHTDPQSADTDDDGIDDANELNNDTNPRKDDSDDDGVEDAEEISGSIVSFTGGVLTIQPSAAGASPVSGTVNSATEIKCDDDDDDRGGTSTARASHDGSDDGDNSGPGSQNSGEQGDDDQGEDEHACTAADLKPGARVHEAELKKATDGSAVFTEIELVPAA